MRNFRTIGTHCGEIRGYVLNRDTRDWKAILCSACVSFVDHAQIALPTKPRTAAPAKCEKQSLLLPESVLSMNSKNTACFGSQKRIFTGWTATLPGSHEQTPSQKARWFAAKGPWRGNLQEASRRPRPVLPSRGEGNVLWDWPCLYGMNLAR